MHHMSFIRGLMGFNERVIYNGDIDPNRIYTMAELKNKIFFNKIFIENMQEVFQKYQTKDIIDDYVDGLNRYINNISGIIQKINEADPTIIISADNLFERRLLTETHIQNQIITQFFKSPADIKYRFLNDVIYYITLLQNGYVAISFVDPRRSMYSETLSHNFGDHSIYWKNDDCIMSYINTMYHSSNTFAIRVTTSRENPMVITKVEYNGSPDNITAVIDMFPSNALIVSNRFIYVDDIQRIIELKMETSTAVHKPKTGLIQMNDIFQKDILVEYPTVSFDEYLQFLSLASADSSVDSIYISLYRIGDNPVIYYILREAVNHGIYVHVNIELCASGESINMMWMKEMQSVGIDVTTYASGTMKVHSKLTLVKFKDDRQIAQIGTGNYQAKTSTQYTDLSLMTSNEDICYQVWKIFQVFKGYDEDGNIKFNKNLLVTQYNARTEILGLIDRESARGKEGYIAIKCNALDDNEIIKHLNNAAKRGCEMDLIIRGVCTWIPDQIGINVRIKSIVWDKLEHSRVYCFGNINPDVYIGSLDLVTNKINKRIETLVKILDPDVLRQTCEYINRYVINTIDSWTLTSSGLYIKE